MRWTTHRRRCWCPRPRSRRRSTPSSRSAIRKTSSRTPSPADYGAAAARYDELRPQDAAWWELFDVLAREGDLVGRRVLDVGCGTGRWAAALAERGSRVWAIDPSPEMVEQARRRGVRAKVAQAESLPFKEGWFERALLVLVVHVLDRPRVFGELRRVLADEGRVAIATFDRRHFDDYYLNPYFPSLADIDRARFPTSEDLIAELEATGFQARVHDVELVSAYDRQTALERIRGRFISTLRMIGEAEFAEGVARAERDLPDRVEARQHMLAMVAVRRPL
ncbi:MAG TPA: methyltransferase domain-containing protein [Gaiellaceae bacterium]|nr:methyltransferase domain-containing protein [Gaiellaceae bacterium]